MALRRKLILSFVAVFVLLSFSFVVVVEADSVMWSQTYGGTDADYGRSVVETSDGGYAIAGCTKSFGDRGGVYWLVKTDEVGNMEWNQTYGGEEDEEAFSLVETSDGGYALAGLTNISNVIGYPKGDFLLVKTDGAGNMEWNKTYETPGGGYAYSVVEASDGGYAIAGEKDRDIWLVKTDAFGNMEWNQTYGKTSWDEAFSLVETSDGGYAIAGRTYDSGAETNYVYLIKTDEFGTVEWERTYGGTGTNWGYSVVETSTGGYAIACTTWSFGAGGADVWLIKTDEYGVVPEYFSWLLTSLLLTATLVIIIYEKKLSHLSS